MSVRNLIKKYPILRGIISYAVIWPTSSICQQTIQGKNWSNYDWKHAARYGFFGSCVVAPMLYGWFRLSSTIWPKQDLKTALMKVFVEQLTYGPLINVTFFFGMSLLESKTISQAIEEVKLKSLPTYKVGLCVWPILQTFNFYFIPERNRVPFISICSIGWTCFLAYMKELDAQRLETMKKQKKSKS